MRTRLETRAERNKNARRLYGGHPFLKTANR
jgi:hypothetical protein